MGKREPTKITATVTKTVTVRPPPRHAKPPPKNSPPPARKRDRTSKKGRGGRIGAKSDGDLDLGNGGRRLARSRTDLIIAKLALAMALFSV